MYFKFPEKRKLTSCQENCDKVTDALAKLAQWFDEKMRWFKRVEVKDNNYSKERSNVKNVLKDS